MRCLGKAQVGVTGAHPMAQTRKSVLLPGPGPNPGVVRLALVREFFEIAHGFPALSGRGRGGGEEGE